MRSFMAHQAKAFEYAVPRSRIALFMEMRLGKSMVAIRWAEARKRRRVLLLGPSAVLQDWDEELRLERFADEDRFLLDEGSIAKRAAVIEENRPGWHLLNFEALLYRPEVLLKNFDTVVVDESSRIKYPKTRITNLLLKFSASEVGRRTDLAILSGMPAPESELDYCTQMLFVSDINKFMGCSTYWTWRQAYFYQAGYDWLPRSGTREKIKQEVEKIAFTMTAQAAGVGNKKVYEKRYVKLTPEQKNYYTQVLKDFEFKDAKGKFVSAKHVPVKLGWLQQICGGFLPNGQFLTNQKHAELIHLLTTELKHLPVVVWFKHTKEIMMAWRMLRKLGINPALYTGKFQKLFKEFAAGDPNVRIMLAQAKCGMYGKRWSRANTMIYFSNWWSSEVRAQSEKRMEHSHKIHPLLYIDLIVKDSIDEKIHHLAITKNLTSKQFLDELTAYWEKKRVFKH